MTSAFLFCSFVCGYDTIEERLDRIEAAIAKLEAKQANKAQQINISTSLPDGTVVMKHSGVMVPITVQQPIKQTEAVLSIDATSCSSSVQATSSSCSLRNGFHPVRAVGRFFHRGKRGCN